MKKYILFVALVVIFSCKKENPDPCEGITCLNNGTCANGLCVCPQGYTGADCSQQVTPSKITITKIQVTKFPATDAGGGGWDFTDGADIYPVISKSSTVLWDSPAYFTNANPSTTYDFTPSPSIDLTSPTNQYQIDLYDYDTVDSDDWMGGIVFVPYTSTNSFPSTITLDIAGGAIAFKLYVTYTW